MCRVQGHRADDGQQLAVEVAFDPGALLVVPVLAQKDVDAVLAQLRQQQEVRYDVPRQSDNLADGLDHLPIDPYEASWGLEELGFDVVRDRRGFTAWWPT